MLKLKNITVKYNDDVILDNISLNINKGDVVAIVGPSGSGKSTLIRTMNLLVKPISGDVLLDGVSLFSQDINKARERIGMVFQQFELFPHLTVLNNMILAPVKLKKMDKERAIKKAKDLLKAMGLQDKINTYPNQLSGGQKQRIAIARALMMKPELLLFDEPTSALDPENVNEVLDVIKELANLNMTIVIVTHMLDFAKVAANRIVFVKDKKIIVENNVNNFFLKPKNKAIKEFLSKCKIH